MGKRFAMVVSALLFLSPIDFSSHYSYGQTSTSEALEPKSRSDEDKNKPDKASEDETNVRLEEGRAMGDQFDQLVADGKFEEAVQLGEKWLSLVRLVSEAQGTSTGQSSSLDDVLEKVASVLVDAKQWDQATDRYSELRERAIAKHGDSHWKVIDAGLAINDIQLLRTFNAEQFEEMRRADELVFLSKSEYQKGDFSSATSHVLEVLAIHRRIFGERHSSCASLLSDLAVQHYSKADYAKAEPLMLESLSIVNECVGEGHPQYAAGMSNLAMLYRAKGESSKALPFLEKSLEITKVTLGEENPSYAVRLNNLGMYYLAVGDLGKAEPLLEKSVEIRGTVLGKNHPDYATSLNNLGQLYETLGDYGKALPLQLESLAIRKISQGEQHPAYADAMSNLAALYTEMGDLVRAEPLSKKSLAIRKNALGENHPRYATGLNNLATIYFMLGDSVRAEPLYKESIAIKKAKYGVQHPDYATSLKNLASLYETLKDYERAEPLFEEAIAIRKATLGDKHPVYAAVLNDLAGLYRSKREYTRAEPLYLESANIRKLALGEQHPEYARALNGLGLFYASKGDYLLAITYYEQALAILKESLGNQHTRYAQCLNNLAELHALMQAYDLAGPLYEECLTITRNQLGNTAFILSERQQLAMYQSSRHRLDSYLRFCLDSPNLPANAVENAVLWKGCVLVRLRGIRKLLDTPSISNQLIQLQQVAAQLSKLTQTIPEPKDSEKWKEQVTKQTAEKEELESKLMRSSQDFRQTMETVSFEQIREAIPADAVLVDYLEFTGKGERGLLASVVKRDGNPVMISLGSAKEASEAIETWRETFGMSTQGKAAGVKLRELLWDPLVEHFGSARTILVSTDGVLGKLPLSALPGKESGSFLIEDYRIALIPVPQLLPALVNEKGRKKLKRELLLMGDVNYDSEPAQADDGKKDRPTPPRKRPSERGQVPDEVRGDIRWNSLSETRAEVEYISGLYKRLFQPTADAVVDLRQSSASETAFRVYAPESEFVHLATHGFFAAPEAKSALSPAMVAEGGQDRVSMVGKDREVIRGHNPGLLSGIVFAGANRKPDTVESLSTQEQPDDGIMTADEIAFLPLDGVRLVVLSACETGLGEVAGGEGLLGIQRGFQIAGARSSIASLWKVNDAATRRLMQEFYTNYLDKEMSILDALREAQLWAIKNPGEMPRGMKRNDESEKPSRLSPQYWAPFVLSGDWR